MARFNEMNEVTMKSKIICLMVTFLAIFLAGAALAKQSLAVGDKAPSLALWTLTGEHFILGDYVGAKAQPKDRRVVVIDFFATWCVPCEAEIPKLQAFDKKHGDKLIVRYISVDKPEDTPLVEKFAEKLGMNKQEVLLDFYHVAAERWDVKKNGQIAVPFCVVVGPDGTVRDVIEGFPDDFERRLQKAVK